MSGVCFTVIQEVGERERVGEGEIGKGGREGREGGSKGKEEDRKRESVWKS